MNKHYTIFLIIALISFAQACYAKMYECTYQNSKGREVVSSYNTLVKNQPNHRELVTALKQGNCKELIVKRYFLDGTICNIQFYKYNKKVGHVTCKPDKPSALEKIKEIARKEYGYYK